MRLGNSVCMYPKASIDSMVIHRTATMSDSIFFIKNNTIIYSRATADIDSIIFYNPFDKGIDVETVAIAGGTFMMGSPTTEFDRKYDETQRQVTLTDFKIGKYEVSNTEFAAFLNARRIGRNGKDPKGTYPTRVLAYDWRNDPYPWAPPAPTDVKSVTEPQKASAIDYYPWGMKFENNQWQAEPGYENHPAIFVSWYGADEFASFIGGRLPSEAQWEYACRAGTTTPFSTGDCISDTQANYRWDRPYNQCDTSKNKMPNTPVAVNSYQPNPWGIYNMHGNLLEWCSDWYSDKFSLEPTVNPEGPTQTYTKVYRGGYFQTSANYLRSAFRDANGAIAANAAIGFRVAIQLDE
ncbi:MAG: hypothetical protein AUK44_10375 [Porphyromonadaceae bacterium CG2_30_38_12]|nr:MAG: hypothetical protein AUK44_10375 [Porphyromonadaceae bacterium CG2_30_38_12]